LLDPPDMSKWGRNEQLHIALRSVHAFHSKYNRYPEIGDADEVSEMSKVINVEAKEKE
jgi:Ubiquitin-activating enzyme E1 four-helix bundle